MAGMRPRGGLWLFLGAVCLGLLATGEVEFALVLDEGKWPASYRKCRSAVEALQSGQATVALKLLRKAVKRFPSDPSVRNTVGVALMFAAREKILSAEHREVYQRAAAEAFSVARKLLPGGDEEEPDMAANARLAQRYLDAARLNKQGVELDRHMRWEEASRSFSAALTKLPEFDAPVANNLGTVLFKNATHHSRSWREAEPLYKSALDLVTKALRLRPSHHAIKKSHAEVSSLLQKIEVWRDSRGGETVPVPADLLKAVAINNTMICTWSGGGPKFQRMALNLFASIRVHVPIWAQAFTVMAIDQEAEQFLRSNGVTTWLVQTADTYMTRWRLLSSLLKVGLHVLLVDTDVVFLGDPFAHFYYDMDLEMMTDHYFPMRDLWDTRWRDEEHLNTGFLFARSSRISINFVEEFISAHHSPWAGDDANSAIGSVGADGTQGGGLFSFDLFDQRLFSRFVRRRIEEGNCHSAYKDYRYGEQFPERFRREGADVNIRNPSVRVLDPHVIAHGASFFWLRWHRLEGLSTPPIAHANFGRHKMYFMRDRGVWFNESLRRRFTEPWPDVDEYHPHASLPDNYFARGEKNLFGGGKAKVRLMTYTHRVRETAEPNASSIEAVVGANFLLLCAALEIAVVLGRRLVLPEAFPCNLLPMYKPYRFEKAFHAEELTKCTFDYFADAERFVKRFDRFILEAGAARTEEFRTFSKRTVHPHELLKAHLSKSQRRAKEIGATAAFRKYLAEQDGEAAEVMEIHSEEDIVKLRDVFRQELGTEPIARSLFPCRWVEFESWFFARRPGQGKPAGRRACGVEGLDCCGVYFGWAEKVEYFADVPWELPCDCGVAADLGCFEQKGGECAREGDKLESAEDLAAELQKSFGVVSPVARSRRRTKKEL